VNLRLKCLVDLTGDFHGLVVKSGFVERLSVVELVVVEVGLKDGQLFVAVGRLYVVVQLVVAVGQQ